MLFRFVIVAWLGCLTIAQAETRVALVIGNSAYANVGRLDNPSRDAASVAKALQDVGFQSVQLENDLSHDALLKALRRFEEAADKADWALVYYAGHGIEVGGINYLIPVDAKIRSDRDVEEETISLAQVQKRLEGARKLRLVILDACRDNPFLAKMRKTRVASRSVGRGLAVPDLPQTGSLVAYSAAAGQVASDGETSSGNSPYATALISNLKIPDLEINMFFRKVRSEVLRATNNDQEPATYESLPDDLFVFFQTRNKNFNSVETSDKKNKVPVSSFPMKSKLVIAHNSFSGDDRNPNLVKELIGIKLSNFHESANSSTSEGAGETLVYKGKIFGRNGAVVIDDVIPFSPAYAISLKQGYLILEVSGQVVHTPDEVLILIEQARKRGDISVNILASDAYGNIKSLDISVN